MRLTDILKPEWVKVPLTCDSKHDAIDELIDVLADHGGVDDRDEMKEAVWNREQTRTTGIGHGVAIPHGKCACCRSLCLAVGLAGDPIEFDSIDGRPVDLIFLLGSPMDQTGPHIQALASISRMLTDAEFRQSIKSAESAAELFEMIKEFEAKVPG